MEASTLSEEAEAETIDQPVDEPLEDVPELENEVLNEPVVENLETEQNEVDINVEVVETQAEVQSNKSAVIQAAGEPQPINQSCEVKSLETSYEKGDASSLAKMSHHSSTSSRATADIIRKPKSRNVSAMDSIEVKSVSSTTSSKFGMEARMFENTELWKFVRQFIPPEQESTVRQKLQGRDCE